MDENLKEKRNSEEFGGVWITVLLAVFALERVWRDHRPAQNPLNRLF